MVCFSSLSVLIDSRWDSALIVEDLWSVRWIDITWTSRNVKACSFLYSLWRPIVFSTYIFGRYGQSPHHACDGFHLLVTWHIVCYVYCVFLSWSLNSKVTVALVVFVARWEFIRRLLISVLFWVNSVIAWSVIQDEKGGPAHWVVFLLFFLDRFSVEFSHWLWKISGRSVRLT